MNIEIEEETLNIMLNSITTAMKFQNEIIEDQRHVCTQARNDQMHAEQQLEQLQLQMQQPAQRTFAVSLEELTQMLDIDFLQSSKINTIKNVRGITGAGLKEAKEYVEQVWIPIIQTLNEMHVAAREERTVDLEKSKEQLKELFK